MFKISQIGLGNKKQQLEELGRFSLLSFVFMLAFIEPASANVFDNLGNAVLAILNNSFLRVLAIIAVVLVGVTALRGQLEWAKAIIVLIAIVFIFGAAGIVDYIKDNAATV
jgi:type IV secretory pathway VirB2 component (pilin)